MSFPSSENCAPSQKSTKQMNDETVNAALKNNLSRDEDLSIAL